MWPFQRLVLVVVKVLFPIVMATPRRHFRYATLAVGKGVGKSAVMRIIAHV